MMLRSLLQKLIPGVALTFLIMACEQQAPEVGAKTSVTTPGLPDSIALRAFNGAFVCADLSDRGEMTNALIANRNQVGPWETFVLVDLGKGQVALRAANGKYVCADQERGDVLFADRDERGEWETFELLSLADDVKVLRASNGKYVCADLAAPGENAGLMVANRTEAKEWESFKIEPVSALKP